MRNRISRVVLWLMNRALPYRIARPFEARIRGIELNPYLVKPTSPYPAWLVRAVRRWLPWLEARMADDEERQSLRLWSVLAAVTPAHKGILDIGAFRGNYALIARNANPCAAIYAFEPNPRSLSTLREKTDGKDIDIQELALGGESGTAEFVVRGSTSKLLAVHHEQERSESDEVVSVRVCTLDEWLDGAGVMPFLIKIDAEGAEARILGAAQRALREAQPIILCEVLSDAAGRDVMAVLPETYKFFMIREDRLGVFERSVLTRKRWNHRNWLCVPNNRRDLLRLLEPVSSKRSVKRFLS